MVDTVGNEDDEEIQSCPKNTVKVVYQVKKNFTPLLSKIIIKHGDIAKNCVTKLVEIRSGLLEMVCGIISEFEKKDLTKIKESPLNSKIATFVDGIKKLNVEVECEEQKKEMSENLKALCDEKAVRKEKLDRAKEESVKIARLVGFSKFKMV